ncbi:hypothetical protein FRB90_008467, partial [Tulasnella sp. 427]
MSLVDVQQRPAIIKQINPSRYLISSPATSAIPRSAHNLSSLHGGSRTVLGSSTAGRIARKRSTQSIGHSWATYGTTTSPQSSQSTSPINPPTQTNDLVKLGTIDLKSAIHSVSVPTSPVQTTTKARKPSPPSNAITPPAGTGPSLPPLSTPSNRPQYPQVTKSSVPRFQIPITPRLGLRLPIFHPGNTTVLPEISRPALVFIPNAPSPPPARRPIRARKPAAKAMALSLGLGSDGSGLDGIETVTGENNNTNISGGKGEKDRASITSDVTPATALPPRSHKKKIVHRDDEPAAPEAGGPEGSAPKASRRPPKRKAAAQAAEVMIVDFNNAIEQDDGGKLSVPAAKRPRRAGPDQHTAATHAPSPLSQEIARAEASPPPALPPPVPTTASIPNPKKRKADSPSSESADADASPPPAVRPKLANASGKARERSNSKTAQNKPKSTFENSDDGLKASVVPGSTSRTVGEPSPENKPTIKDTSEGGNSDSKQQDKDSKTVDDDDDEDDEDDELPRRSYNMFEEPIELKPRPRPTYKAHLKRLSTGSFGDDRPSRPRASKAKKSSSSGSSRSQSRKESEDAHQQQTSSSTLTSASPETEARAFLPQVTPTPAYTPMKSEAMDIDTPIPNVPQTAPAVGVSLA